MESQLAIFILLAVFVGAAAIHDVLNRRIPNKLIVFGWSIAVASQSTFGDSNAVQNVLYGTAIGCVLLLPFYAVKGMAAGDVKMMMVVGAFAGPALTLNIVLATFIFGGIGAIAIVLYNRKLNEAVVNMRVILMSYLLRMTQNGASSMNRDATSFPSIGRMPYGPAIALATITVLLLQ